MLFNSMNFLLFFPIVVFVYYCIPKKIRYFWLLASSYYFYMKWNPVYGLLLFFCTFVTYEGAAILEKSGQPQEDKDGKRKLCLAVCLFINLGILAFFKYCNFAISMMNKIISLIWPGFCISWTNPVELPVGISFYVLQSLGYLIDVYRREIYAEKNLFRYALFVSFFPQLVAGPIERSKNLLVQLSEPREFSFNNCKKGLFIMLWGFFAKLVIADRAAIFVNKVYGDSAAYPGLYIVLATFLFAVQIYCDFYGYSTIARGAALFFGISLTDNFNAPYFSRSVEEFWRRWHISLSGWFRDYLYIPLGGNRKGMFRKQMNKLIVFTVSGLWHGASLAFITWGFLNGIYQVAAGSIKGLKKKLNIRVHERSTFSDRILQQAGTFVLICFTWIFFRAGDMSDSFLIIRNMFCFNWEILVNGDLYRLGISRELFGVLLCAIGALVYVDHKKYEGSDVAAVLTEQKWWFQIAAVIILLFTVLVYGCYRVSYDTNQFIYFQF